MNRPPPAKIGATHMPAMGRLGLKEAAQILKAFPDSIQLIEEPGLAGNALPQEVYRDRHGSELHPELDLDLEYEDELELQM